MQWTRSETIGIAKLACTHCHGVGLKPGRNEYDVPCNCVFREIFRSCYLRFVECIRTERHLSVVSFEPCYGSERRAMYSRKTEEYIADFTIIAKRLLDEEDYRIFRFHFLLGADWKQCCARLNMDRGTFFHTVYRIEHTLGKRYREVRPYPLFPVDEYFGGVLERKPPRALKPARRRTAREMQSQMIA